MFELNHQLAADTLVLGDLPLSQMLLMNDANYPWIILVPRRLNIQENYQLSHSDQQQLMKESNEVGRLMMQYFNGDKLNVAALGNIVSQLHIHHVVRFETDLAWPNPIWGAYPALKYSESKLFEICEELSALFIKELGMKSC